MSGMYYERAVSHVLEALGRLRLQGLCPPLLFLPDVMVWPSSDAPVGKTDAERFESKGYLALDGHACIGALTAAHLSLGPACEYSVILATKAGGTGKDLLDDAEAELRRHGCTLFHVLIAAGKDRIISTPTNTAEKVNRDVWEREPVNQLSWAELDALRCLPWLEDKQFGVVLGEAESFLVEHDPGRMKELIDRAAVAIIDTIAFADKPDRAHKLWKNIQTLVSDDNLTIVSVSDQDASLIAAANGLEPAGPAGAESFCRALAKSLKGGYLVMHGKDRNVVFACPSAEVCALVPASDIKPRATNGAGDTFNGGLAVAATALRLDPERTGVPFTSALEDAVAFATAAVSLRLESGDYATRPDLLTRAGKLRPKGEVTPTADAEEQQGVVENREDLVVQSQWLAHVLAPCWNNVPKLALVDLDHTLCDSRRWRLTAAMAALRTLDLKADDEDLIALYENIYEDHGAWEPIIDANVRYTWWAPELFELVIALSRRLPLLDDYRDLKDELLSGKDHALDDELRKVRKTCAKQVAAAVETFKNTPAFPYPDSVAGLYQLRDVLGFRLMIVTEGDHDVQCEKVEMLRLHDIFPPNRDVVHAEKALPSPRQLDRAFGEVSIRTAGHERAEVDKAHAICIANYAAMKSSSRADAFRSALTSALGNQTKQAASKRYEPLGAYICTIGDRLDTDVAAYVQIRKELLDDGGHRGIIIGRLKRGYYKDQEKPEGADPDLEVSSLPEFAAKLADPAFWRGKPTIRDVKPSVKPSLSKSDKKLLKSVAKKHSSLGPFIDPIV